MKTLATSNSIFGNNTASPHFSASRSLRERLLCGGTEFISYRTPPKLASSGLQHLPSLRRGGIHLFTSLSSHHQVDTQNDPVENQDTNQAKTVRVKFQLQKECTFGEQFLVVGDDPIIGSWDVTSAIALNWADGHQWAAEVEIPVGKTIQFKFVLQGKTGNVVWQPGPDRTFQPWETTNTIIVSEVWDSTESLKLTEEETVVNQNEDSPIVSQKLMIVENLTYPNEGLIHNINKEPSVALGDTSIAEKSSVESHEELIDASIISASKENGSDISALDENAGNISLPEENASDISAAKYIVAENISYLKESFVLNTSNNAIGKVYSNSNGESTFTSQSDTKITEGIVESHEKGATVKILGNPDVQESSINCGVPILVPGLPPTPTTSNQAAPQHEVKSDVSINGINESNGHELPENIQMNQKQDPYLVAEQEIEAKLSYGEDYDEDDKEDGLQSEIRQKDDKNKIENRSDLQEINNDILKNDMTWGHKTLMKFFANLKFL